MRIAEHPREPFVVKLRGAAQGTGALVAEMVAASLAGELGLRVPPSALVHVPADLPTDDPDDELADLLRASVGLNLGFAFLSEGRAFVAGDAETIPLETRAATLWLDRFILNPDRTRRNPNLMIDREGVVLIDHGAALRFQYDWSRVTEESPRQVGESYEPHLFDTGAADESWRESDERFAARFSRGVLEAALARVPDDFLRSIPAGSDPADPVRRRAAYVAFLWKRLKAPRAFAIEPPRFAASARRGVPPPWVLAPR